MHYYQFSILQNEFFIKIREIVNFKNAHFYPSALHLLMMLLNSLFNLTLNRYYFAFPPNFSQDSSFNFILKKKGEKTNLSPLLS